MISLKWISSNTVCVFCLFLCDLHKIYSYEFTTQDEVCAITYKQNS